MCMVLQFFEGRASFTGFDIMTHDSYFTILVFMNHILAVNIFHKYIEWTEYKIIVFKPASMYQIIQHCHKFQKHSYQQFSASSISLSSKSFINITFYRARNNKLERQSNTFILYLVYPGVRKASHKFMKHKEIWFAL